MTRKANISYIAFTIICLVLMSGCRSSKTSVEPSGYQSGIVPSDTPRSLTPQQSVAALIDSYSSRVSWTDLSIPVKCTLRSPKSISVSGRLVMVKDKSIALSLRMLGFEVAGLYADRDSIFIYEKINKSLVAEPLSRLTDATGLTLPDLQNLLTGEVCYPGKELTASNATKLFTITADSDEIRLTPRDAQGWSYTLSADNMPVLSSAHVESAKAQATCIFGAPQPSSAGSFIPSVTINAEAGKHKLDASMVYSIYDIKANASTKSSKPSFKGYRRIPINSLVKALGAF